MKYLKKAGRSKLLLISITLLAFFLRVYRLDQYPPSLYSDEVSQGYNAYSILKTGRDEMGTLLPVSIRSFGDWKPPLQTYLMIPTIALFGLNEWGVRLPGALLGALTIPLLYYVILLFIAHLAAPNSWLQSKKNKVALTAALFLTISPWHIAMSRSAMLVGVGLFCLFLAIKSFIKGIEKPNYMLGSAVAFVLTIYSYYGLRFIAPLVLLVLCLVFWQEFKAKFKSYFPSLLLGLVLLLPLFLAFVHEPNVLFGRAKTVSIFYQQNVALKQWDMLSQDGAAGGRIVKIFHNKIYLYSLEIVERFFEHLSGKFLLTVGGTETPFQIPGMGVVYAFDVLFGAIGLAFLMRRELKLGLILIALSVIFIFPAALTYLTPAPNRTFNWVAIIMLVSAIGLVLVSEKIHTRIGKISLVILAVGQLSYFLYQYTVVLPTDYSYWWHFGNKELVQQLPRLADENSTIYVSEHVAQPYIFLLFYQHVDPKTAQAEIQRNFIADEVGFEHVQGFGNYVFFDDTFSKSQLFKLRKGDIVVTSEYDKFTPPGTTVNQIYYPNHRLAYTIYKVD